MKSEIRNLRPEIPEEGRKFPTRNKVQKKLCDKTRRRWGEMPGETVGNL